MGIARVAVLCSLAAVLTAIAQTPSTARIRIETEAGAIDIEVDLAHAPRTAANFLRYVDAGLYDQGLVHRTVRADNQPNNAVTIAVIQGAANPDRADEFFAPIPIERTSVTGLRHLDGVVSMARAEPDSARDEFFICIGDQPSLDFGGARNPDGQGFAAFGRVVAGMDVVRAIQARPADGQTLRPPVRILRARRE
jgi:peptidyl-prolyl cis-trans isomerase A (cyclophilin A)